MSTTKAKYIKDGIIKPRYAITLTTEDGRARTCPSHDALIEAGWAVYREAEPSAEVKLQRAKQAKIAMIQRYDKSNAVNYFYIGDVGLWLDKETRVGLKLRFEAEVALGREETTLWHNGMQFPLPLSTATQMLYALEVYASACYDNTQAHLAAVDALTTIEEVNTYDYTLFYPEKLKF